MPVSSLPLALPLFSASVQILHDMFGLWVRTEEDLMDPQNPYRLRNTGQGLNRVQQAPRIGKAMHNILAHCQRKVGNTPTHVCSSAVPRSRLL